MSQQPPDPYRQPPWAAPPGYGQPPGQGAPAAQMPHPGKAPTQVRWAGRIMIAAGVLGAAYSALVPAYGSYLLARLRQSFRAYQQYGVDVDAMVTLALIVSFVSAAILIGLWLWWAVMVRLGRNWARVLATIFAALYVTTDAASYAAGPATAVARTPAYAVVMDIAILLGMAVGIVLAWSRPAREWFRTRKAWKRQQRFLSRSHW